MALLVLRDFGTRVANTMYECNFSVITIEIIEKENDKPKVQRIPSIAVNEDGFLLMKRKSSFF
jgi:hypothetical protein